MINKQFKVVYITSIILLTVHQGKQFFRYENYKFYVSVNFFFFFVDIKIQTVRNGGFVSKPGPQEMCKGRTYESVSQVRRSRYVRRNNVHDLETNITGHRWDQTNRVISYYRCFIFWNIKVPLLIYVFDLLVHPNNSQRVCIL